jgi:LysM repeat protein
VSPTSTPVPTAPPSPTPFSYVVASGDTMAAVARRFGVSMEELVAANPAIKNPNQIKIGDRLIIPGAGGSPSTSPTASPSAGP